VALVLLVWGTVDQARYYLSLRSDDMRALQRAAALDSFDSSLQMRLARKEIQDGQPQQAEASWRRAMSANPADPAPRQALLQFLIDQNRFDEAFRLTEASLQYAPKDANLLVDRGFLALRRGQAEQAVANWKEALAVDPNQRLAHLYLADELDREGNAQAAASHYNSFLEQIARQRAQDRPAPEKVIAIALRMADCQVRSSQTELALKSYHLAEKLAAQTSQAKLESVADVNEADLQSKTGNLDEALQLYQRALRLDDSLSDTNASAEDWFAYGRFLDEAGFPARLAYACLVKSESATQSLHAGAVQGYRVAARQRIEKQLGAAAEEVRRNPEPMLQQALVLRR
jgi:tetratricopeptide (TPR) repeat protein